VEGSNSHSACAAELASLLCEEKMSVIDFDRLKSWLGEIAPILDESESRRADLAALRQDYEGRIAGMAKAIAVADRKGKFESALALIESLPHMTIAELMACYQRTSARFRDTFPGSFALPSIRGLRPSRPGEFEDYK